jgi:hypothetical protein
VFKHTTQIDQVTLDGEDAVENLGRGRVEDRILKLVDVLVEVVDCREIVIDDGIEDEIEQARRVLVVTIAPCALKRFTCGRAVGIVDDGDEKVFARKDVDRGESRHLVSGIIGVGPQIDRLEDCEGIVRTYVDLDALVFAAYILDVQRVKVVLARKLVEPRVMRVVELIPGHGE